MKQLIATALLALAAPGQGAPEHEAPTRPYAWSERAVELARSLPVQDGGRIKPLDTYAGFTLLRLNGKRSVVTPSGERLAPIEWLLDALIFPEVAATYPVFLLQNVETALAIDVPTYGKEKRDRYSFDELRPGLPRLFELARDWSSIEKERRSPVQDQVVHLAENVQTFLHLAGHLDFARGTFSVGESEALAELFGGERDVRYDEIVARAGELRALHARLSAEPPEAARGELAAVGGFLGTAAEIPSESVSLALFAPPLAQGEAPGTPAAWWSPADLLVQSYQGGGVGEDHVEALRAFGALIATREDPAGFERELAAAHGLLTGLGAARGETGRLGLELTYYDAKVVSRSLVLFVLGFVVVALLWIRPRSRVLYGGAWAATVGGLALLTAGIVMRCLIRGRPPVSTLYETVLFVAATGILIALCAEVLDRRRVALSGAALLGTLGMFVANGYETLDARDTMPSLVAVLDTNFWLATHVTAITIGYSAGLLAALFGSFFVVAKLVRRGRPEPEFDRRLARTVYGVLCFGLIFSIVGTILGGIWANDSWGRFWGWDPKENGALMIVLSQIAILHARLCGWLKHHGLCVAAALAGIVVAFSWWGVNLLGVGLHSYGFTRGVQNALWTYYGIQWGVGALGGLAWWLERCHLAAGPASGSPGSEPESALPDSEAPTPSENPAQVA